MKKYILTEEFRNQLIHFIRSARTDFPTEACISVFNQLINLPIYQEPQSLVDAQPNEVKPEITAN